MFYKKIKNFLIYLNKTTIYFSAEIIFLIFKISESLLEPSLKLYIYHQICFRLLSNTNELKCKNLNLFPKLEDQIQSDAAIYLTCYKIILNFPAIFLCLFCGAWSDKVGRKLPIILSSLLSTFGVFFFLSTTFVPFNSNKNHTISILNSDINNNNNNNNTYNNNNNNNNDNNINENVLNNKSPLSSNITLKNNEFLFLTLFFIGTFLRGFSGKASLVTMSVHSYVSDMSDNFERTERLGRLLSMNFFGTFLGSLVLGLFLEKFSFRVVFIFVLLLYSSTSLFTYFFMLPKNKNKDNYNGCCCCHRDMEEEEEDVSQIEIKNKKLEKRNKIQLPSPSSSSSPPSSTPSFFETLVSQSPFKLYHIKNLIKLIKKLRKKKLFFFFFFIVFQQLCKSGEVDVLMLYTAKSPLFWQKTLYSYYLAFDFVFLGFSTAFLLPFLIKCFFLTDLTLAIIGIVSKIIRLIMLCLTTNTTMVFCSALIGSPSSLILCLKSLISKRFKDEELGKVFSLLSGFETFSNLIGTLVFNSIYFYTFEFYTGFVFGLDAILFMIILFFIIIQDLAGCYDYIEKDLEEDEKEEEEEEEKGVEKIIHKNLNFEIVNSFNDDYKSNDNFAYENHDEKTQNIENKHKNYGSMMHDKK